MRSLILLCALSAALAAASPAAAVIGGRPATEAYPWQAALADAGGQFCGASLVRPDWVLTAAHCADGEEASKLHVILGRHKLSSSDGEEIPVAEIVVHEKYAGDDAGGHDIALLRLERPSAAAPLRIVSPAEAALWAPGRPARVIGWGSSVFLVGPGSDDLQEVDVPMVADEDCDTNYNSLSPFAFDPATMVCAGETTGGKDSCQGDSGGPLVVKDSTGAWTQVGTVSFGLGCGFPLYYGVYGRIGGPALNAWLAARLPAATAPPPPDSAGPQAPPPAAAPAPPATTPARLSFRRALGSARAARRARAVRVRITSRVALKAVRVTVLRGGRIVATGRRASLKGTATLRLRAKPARIRPGAVLVRIQAVDGSGRAVRRSGIARLAR
jgi:pyruvate/2-oxoglutarate dehydrogenase complex dihydrolipoamide acyltransferase (E2) component